MGTKTNGGFDVEKIQLNLFFYITMISTPILLFTGYFSDIFFYSTLIFFGLFIFSTSWLYGTKIIQWFLKYRKTFLALASILGMVLAYGMYDFFSGERDLENNVLHSSLTILALGLPTFFMLWLFRTHDIQENINNSTFFECARMLTEEYPTGDTLATLPPQIALKQLAYLRRKTNFNRERIDLLTQGLKLNEIFLVNAYLDGIDFI